MCDECAFCYAAKWRTPLRLTPENELICEDCWDAPDWDELTTPEDAAELHLAMLDDKAHAMRDRRARL